MVTAEGRDREPQGGGVTIRLTGRSPFSTQRNLRNRFIPATKATADLCTAVRAQAVTIVIRGEVDEAQGEIEGESKGQIFGTKA